MYMLSAYNVDAPKKATNLTINADLLKKAKSYKINAVAASRRLIVTIML